MATTHPSETRRPHSLAEAVDWGKTQGDTDFFLREFLDTFYIADTPAERAAMLEKEPELQGRDTMDAYVAAMAEHLAREYRLPVPAWTEGKQRFLRRAHFPGGQDSLRATWIKESPAAFRRRLIFVDIDPLYRPRKTSPGIGGVK
jgi:hypothetical protein